MVIFHSFLYVYQRVKPPWDINGITPGCQQIIFRSSASGKIAENLGKHTKNHGKSPCFMGKSTISIRAIFSSKLLVYQAGYKWGSFHQTTFGDSRATRTFRSLGRTWLRAPVIRHGNGKSPTHNFLIVLFKPEFRSWISHLAELQYYSLQQYPLIFPCIYLSIYLYIYIHIPWLLVKSLTIHHLLMDKLSKNMDRLY